MIKIVNVKKSYHKQQILDEVSFEVSSGDCACIIGENGSGKSTLLSIISGLTRPDDGQVILPKGSIISFVPQSDFLFEDISVKNNLDFWSAAAGQSLASPQVKSAIELFDLFPFLNKKVSQLSGGMRRRVALCVGILKNPNLLVLDEPFTGLDILHKREINNYLNSIRKTGTTLIYTTHNVDEIKFLANQLLVLSKRKIRDIDMDEFFKDVDKNITILLKGEVF